NPGYDPTISTWFWSPTTCTGGGGNGGGGGGGAGGGGGGAGGGGSGGGGGTGTGNGSLVFSAYKDTSINMNWNTHVITTNVGVDFDIEAGQSQAVINELVARIKTAHASYPNLRFSLTLATLANNNGASTAQSLGAGAPDSFNVYGDWTMAAVKSVFGFNGSPS